jgi:DNA topoisomerase-1
MSRAKPPRSPRAQPYQPTTSATDPFASPSPLLINYVVRTSTATDRGDAAASQQSHVATAWNLAYWDPRTRKQVTHPALIATWAKVGMPPGYARVFYNLDPSSDLVAIGIDAAGRKQYRYSAETVEEQSHLKFDRLIVFIAALPSIRHEIQLHLQSVPKQSGIPQSMDQVCALALWLMDVGHFRIGSEQYRNAHESYGVSNIVPAHLQRLKSNPTALIISFKGKSGMQNEALLDLAHPWAAMLWRLREDAKVHSPDHLFQFRDSDDGTRKCLHSTHINEMIARHGNVTAKDFRTYAANSELLQRLLPADIPEVPETESTATHSLTGAGRPSKHTKQHSSFAPRASSSALTLAERKSCLRQSITEVATLLHHTAANCKKSYIFPNLVNLFLTQPHSLWQVYQHVQREQAQEPQLRSRSKDVAPPVPPVDATLVYLLRLQSDLE